MRERLGGKQIETVPLQARSEEQLEALLQMTPIRAAFICSKACDIFAEDAFSVINLRTKLSGVTKSNQLRSKQQQRFMFPCMASRRHF